MTTEPITDYTEQMRACAEAIDLNPPAIVLPTDHFVQLGKMRFHYLDWGNPHLPHLIMVHGGGLTAHTWDMAALLLRDKYHLVAFDLRGHGLSDWMDEEDLKHDLTDMMSGDVFRFLEFLNYDSVSLTGMSFGGVASMRYAAQHPERVHALILVDVGPESMREFSNSTQQFHRETDVLERFDDFLDRAARFNPTPINICFKTLIALCAPVTPSRAPAVQPAALAEADARGLDVAAGPAPARQRRARPGGGSRRTIRGARRGVVGHREAGHGADARAARRRAC